MLTFQVNPGLPPTNQSIDAFSRTTECRFLACVSGMRKSGSFVDPVKAPQPMLLRDRHVRGERKIWFAIELCDLCWKNSRHAFSGLPDCGAVRVLSLRCHWVSVTVFDFSARLHSAELDSLPTVPISSHLSFSRNSSHRSVGEYDLGKRLLCPFFLDIMVVAHLVARVSRDIIPIQPRALSSSLDLTIHSYNPLCLDLTTLSTRFPYDPFSAHARHLTS
ncbi:uncharacterized protein BDR25DRAFT_363956 [Lindgomyces ingoldianus]|uniref:Uncharacterized protein n=1 Tax=Lindgomyces ingoldianus TaxID=673940 RepID=A0ACB6Q6V5_9PLEO|nr:uncharacterized protein BDR25DRAFT_363956 [Lindgomyces ingoldianus]KAF2462540.1 hypothetical protein BDR25DRAFT_363956 [Lindgomyces ingoldianus]